MRSVLPFSRAWIQPRPTFPSLGCSIYLGTIQRGLPKGWIEGSIDNISGAIAREPISSSFLSRFEADYFLSLQISGVSTIRRSSKEDIQFTRESRRAVVINSSKLTLLLPDLESFSANEHNVSCLSPYIYLKTMLIMSHSRSPSTMLLRRLVRLGSRTQRGSTCSTLVRFSHLFAFLRKTR